MSTSKELDRRVRIGKFIELNKNWRKSEVVEHFVAEGIPRKTVYDIIKRFEKGIDASRQPGSGSHMAIPNRKKDKIIETSVNEVGMSYRAIGRKTGVSPPMVKKVLLEAGIQRNPRIKCPKTSEKQKKTQKTRLDNLRKTIFKAENNVICIMDDESYFTIDGSDTNFNSFYYSHPCLETPENVKYREVAKFPEKVLVWCAISPKGMSEPYIVKSGNAVTAAVYIKECLPKLVDFINKYHANDNYIFWPDLTSAHYAKVTLEAYRQMNIKYVPKNINPPNVPQLRPIESFWAILGQKLYNNGWTTDDLKKLIRRIRYLIRETPLDQLRNLMRDTGLKVRAAANRGVLSVIN